jgi:hypothetical protein
LKKIVSIEGTWILELDSKDVWKLTPRQHSSKLLYKVQRFSSFELLMLVGVLFDFLVDKGVGILTGTSSSS